MKRTVVICDDDPVARRVIENLVKRAGYAVVAEAEVAVSAVAMVAYHQPAVLVMDVSMPGMRGTDALDLVREACADTRVILVSAFDMVPRTAFPDGVYDMIDKSDFVDLTRVLTGIAAIAAA